MSASKWWRATFIGLVVLALALPAWAAGSEGGKKQGRGYRLDKNGWVYLHLEGGPFERGFQHGFLAADEIKEVLRCLKFVTYWETGKKWEFFADAAAKLWVKHIDQEFLDEIKGIAAGAQKAGVEVTWKDILCWNGHEELTDYWWPNAKAKYKYAPSIPGKDDHCSAFIATGSATAGGKIVVAHNSFDNFETGQFFNVIIDIKPDKGNRILMQAAPGFIQSGTDFAVTSAGLIITETTIGGYSLYDENEAPEFFRLRKAAQYATDLDSFVGIMKKKNNGGYANSWLVGDVNTGEIMRLELGLRFYNVERKKDGYFIGYNAPLDPRIRNLECANTGFADIRRHQGARQVRLTQLMEKHYGKIDVEIAKLILADHYDVYLKKINPSSRTIDAHYELDAREYMSQPGRPLPFQPRGAVDGKVTDSELAKAFKLWARWGNSSGMPFDAEKHLKEHIQWRHLKGYLHDRPTQPWTLFTAGMK